MIARLALTFTEYMRTLARSQEEAVSDPLTGLQNRRALTLHLEDTLHGGGERSAMILFDLDGFKSYNDTFGHPAGDALLEQIARNAADALVTRGELFEITASYGVVVVPDETASLTDAMRLADQRLYLHKGVGPAFADGP